ncbi:hypothetical protein TrRE_jg5176 [Triparma retinervis]|uniref:Uncharacterized protein n=1 Tax=Triparma retinervis TaxID=2557542 RepID=A0A9W7C7N9_9STRA|nr:hypothetical protein TrRE_jg5176 [Triparma retinervis]
MPAAGRSKRRRGANPTRAIEITVEKAKQRYFEDTDELDHFLTAGSPKYGMKAYENPFGGGDLYVGPMADGYANGMGAYINLDGTKQGMVYEGNFANNLCDGKGKSWWITRGKLNTIWASGCHLGTDIPKAKTKTDNSVPYKVLTGEWTADKKEGDFQIELKNGSVLNVTFKKGVCKSSAAATAPAVPVHVAPAAAAAVLAVPVALPVAVQLIVEDDAFAAWLRSVLGEVPTATVDAIIAKCQAEDVTKSSLRMMDDDELVQLGFKMGPRKELKATWKA